MPIRSYKDLEVYQESYRLALEVHEVTQQFPDAERYELGRQLRRAAMSIPLNIAEGYGRKRSGADFKHFLGMSAGSCNEVQVILDFVNDLGYVSEEVYQGLVEHYASIGRRLYALMNKWE